MGYSLWVPKSWTQLSDFHNFFFFFTSGLSILTSFAPLACGGTAVS